jgi:hypothetical protein
MITEATEKQIKHLQLQIDAYVKKIQEYQYKINKASSQMAELKKLKYIREIYVTEHAIKRFQERVLHIEGRKIRQLLSSKDLVEKYQNGGDGKYQLKDYPYVIVVIEKYRVMTVINKLNAEERLKMLSNYMDYFIDEIALKHTGHDVKIMKINTFRGLYWRNQLKNKKNVA